MMARRGVLGLLAGGAAALLSGCGSLFGGNEYRYKLTVEVETPEGLRTGFAVRQVNWSAGRNITQEASTASMAHKGEAVMVDLPNGQTLFALMSPDGQETPMLAFGSATLDSSADRSVKELSPPARPEARYGDSGYPRLVRFRDINDLKTVEKVDPANLAASFGAGYRLKRITTQIVDDDVTELVVKKLPWIVQYRDKQFSGEKYQSSDGLKKYGLAAVTASGDFVMGMGR
jgi:hypothetical protein